MNKAKTQTVSSRRIAERAIERSKSSKGQSWHELLSKGQPVSDGPSPSDELEHKPSPAEDDCIAANAAKKKYTFQPDYISPPGDTLKEVLEMQGLSQADFAVRCGMAEKTISQIINSVAPITVETAEKFELVTGVPATFWNRRELTYREAISRQEAAARMQADVEWLKELPVKELIDRELVEPSNDKPTMVRRLLEFFGVSSVDAWKTVLSGATVQFRGGEAHDRYPGYVAAWRRIGVILAQQINTEPFDSQEFSKALTAVRNLTTRPAGEWSGEITRLCAAAGVAFVMVPEIPHASISGAARWLTKDKALIQLSLKYKSDDQFWFTFFHEAGHILLHGKKQVFVDYGYSADTEEEREANRFARNFLIPESKAHYLPTLKTRKQIKTFAKMLGISDGIVVGRLQHDDLRFKSAFNDLKRKLEWA
jgi:transcriptional regulator with XRE-family HTH domain